MTDDRFHRLSRAILDLGVAGAEEHVILARLCEDLHREGIIIARASAVIDTLHPVFEGRAFRWRPDMTGIEPVIAFGRTVNGGKEADSWRNSPFFHLIERKERLLRRKLAGTHPLEFPILDELREQGFSDYVAGVVPFDDLGTIGYMDCFHASWATAGSNGFTEADIDLLDRLLTVLAIAIKCTSQTRIAETLAETYLGRGAGRMVLNGNIERGVAEKISAVLWFSDLRNYTRITDAAAPDLVIPFLNDYAEAVISSIQEAGGDVLKLIGDGILAIFRADDPETACRCALTAEAIMRGRAADLLAERSRQGLPTTEIYVALHVGEVFYGNIGSKDRLDFTVVGPAVNEVTRISALCRSVEKDVLLSSAFHAALAPAQRDRLVSVGRFAMKGVARPQELYTLDLTPAEAAA